MARTESDREDLMREATALVKRIEFSIADKPGLIVAGFRKSGALSIYFEPDLVYHVDEKLRLRRAYVDGFLYRTQGTTLARLDHQRTETHTILNRYDLKEDELKQFCQTVESNMQNLLNALHQQTIKVHQQIPADVSILAALQKAVQQILVDGIELAPVIVAKK